MSTKIDTAFEKKTYRCIAKTLSDALQDAGIKEVDILKIDVEMMEDKVLKGITKELWSNIEQVVIEVHDIGDRIKETINLLESSGFKVSQTEPKPPSFILGNNVEKTVKGLDVCLITGQRLCEDLNVNANITNF